MSGKLYRFVLSLLAIFALASPTFADSLTLSTSSDQFAAAIPGGVTMLHQGLYTARVDVLPATPAFVTGAVGLDAVDVLADGTVLFSPGADGVMHHSGGTILLLHNALYTFDPRSGEIRTYDHLADHGIDLLTIDAVDSLADGSLAFSTATYQFVMHTLGVLTLQPECVYRFDPVSGAIELLFDGYSIGLTNIDGFEVRPGEGFAFSSDSDGYLATNEGGVYTRHEDIYVYDDGSLSLMFDGSAEGIHSVDAFTLGAPMRQPGLRLEADSWEALLDEGSRAVRQTYSISLSRQPESDVVVSLSSPDRQLGFDPQQITFTPDNWDGPRTVEVWAVDDRMIESSTHTGRLTHTSITQAPTFRDVVLPAMEFAIRDNDKIRGRARVETIQNGDPTIEFDRNRTAEDNRPSRAAPGKGTCDRGYGTSPPAGSSRSRGDRRR